MSFTAPAGKVTGFLGPNGSVHLWAAGSWRTLAGGVAVNVAFAAAMVTTLRRDVT